MNKIFFITKTGIMLFAFVGWSFLPMFDYFIVRLFMALGIGMMGGQLAPHLIREGREIWRDKEVHDFMLKHREVKKHG